MVKAIGGMLVGPRIALDATRATNGVPVRTFAIKIAPNSHTRRICDCECFLDSVSTIVDLVPKLLDLLSCLTRLLLIM